jgi:hypothetical protein
MVQILPSLVGGYTSDGTPTTANVNCTGPLSDPIALPIDVKMTTDFFSLI